MCNLQIFCGNHKKNLSSIFIQVLKDDNVNIFVLHGAIYQHANQPLSDIKVHINEWLSTMYKSKTNVIEQIYKKFLKIETAFRSLYKSHFVKTKTYIHIEYLKQAILQLCTNNIVQLWIASFAIDQYTKYIKDICTSLQNLKLNDKEIYDIFMPFNEILNKELIKQLTSASDIVHMYNMYIKYITYVEELFNCTKVYDDVGSNYIINQINTYFANKTNISISEFAIIEIYEKLSQSGVSDKLKELLLEYVNTITITPQYHKNNQVFQKISTYLLHLQRISVIDNNTKEAIVTKIWEKHQHIIKYYIHGMQQLICNNYNNSDIVENIIIPLLKIALCGKNVDILLEHYYQSLISRKTLILKEKNNLVQEQNIITKLLPTDRVLSQFTKITSYLKDIEKSIDFMDNLKKINIVFKNKENIVQNINNFDLDNCQLFIKNQYSSHFDEKLFHNIIIPIIFKPYIKTIETYHNTKFTHRKICIDYTNTNVTINNGKVNITGPILPMIVLVYVSNKDVTETSLYNMIFTKYENTYTHLLANAIELLVKNNVLAKNNNIFTAKELEHDVVLTIDSVKNNTIIKNIEIDRKNTTRCYIVKAAKQALAQNIQVNETQLYHNTQKLLKIYDITYEEFKTHLEYCLEYDFLKKDKEYICY